MIYFKRTLGLPFFMALMIIAFLFNFFTKSFLWLKYGGEAVNYSEKMNRKTITDCFLAIEEARNESK